MYRMGSSGDVVASTRVGRRSGHKTKVWRGVIVGIAAGALAATAAVAVPAASAVPASNTVTSGDARFQVLSDTLIRAEFAPNGTDLTDAATFNAIGRDDFAPVEFTQASVGGWLTITTDKAQLRYKEGSGKFDGTNLKLTVDGKDVTPTFGRVDQCELNRICEAEEGQLYNIGVEAEHAGYTGRGFVAGWGGSTTHATYQFVAPQTGTYDLHLRYANGTGLGRTLSYTFDNAPLRKVTLPPLTATPPETNNWKAWGTTVIEDVPLTVGAHNFYLVRTATDTGSVNLDALALTAANDSYPSPTPGQCTFGVPCEAEAGTLEGQVVRAYNHPNFSGSGFAGGFLATGAKSALNVTDVPADGQYWVHVRYANGPTTFTPTVNRKIAIGGSIVTLPSTGSDDAAWGRWTDYSFQKNLTTGTNDLTIERTNLSDGSVNIDSVTVSDSATPPPAHIQVGGYVRSLDNVDKQTTLAPGLLYRDGWMLLDDTVTSLWNTGTLTATDRSIQEADYQDGYVFAYGSDFKAALQDLRTLTGPSKLLPRWAYGVWFSEYRDFSQAEYEEDIIGAFESKNVPLDALVSDTDFKKLNKWNGWEFDLTRFPDPAGFFDFSQSKGIANILNIHASIDTGDGLYQQYKDDLDAAGGNSAAIDTTESGQGCKMFGATPTRECATFDWSDPAQLTAYMKLHDHIDDIGADVWWLDWSTADYSSASGQGYGDDAFINEQYAGQKGYLANVSDTETAADSARGFGFSRTFGDNLTPLQSGIWNSSNVPVYGSNGPSYGAVVGPWADKRSTLHFTGDARSTFNSLTSQIAFTADESAATGMSAISHDIGGFQQADDLFQTGTGANKRLWDDLYVRWVQFGVFQPILRLHGDHSARMPWQYPANVEAATSDFLRLRNKLMPYIYTAAKQAEDTGLPVVRAMYLEHPTDQRAYDYSKSQYYFGDNLLVAPITSIGNPASTSVWLPEGTWTDFFTGERHVSDGELVLENVSRDFTQMPVYIREGGIITTRTTAVTNDYKNPLDEVTVTIGVGASGTHVMYEDDGETTNTATESARTPITYTEDENGSSLTIGAAEGSFDGQVQARDWTIRYVGLDEAPASITIGGQVLTPGDFEFDAATGALTFTVTDKAPTEAIEAGIVTVADEPVQSVVNLTATPAAPTTADDVTLTASVTPAMATGTVTFLNGTTTVGTGTLSGGVATFTGKFAEGTHSLTAAYAGSDGVLGATSAVVSLTVTKKPDTPQPPVTPVAAITGATLSATKQVFGAKKPATVQVTVANATSGKIQVRLGNKSLGTKAVTKTGSKYGATFTVPKSLAVGTYRGLAVTLSDVPSQAIKTANFAAAFRVTKAKPRSIKAKQVGRKSAKRPTLRVTVGKLNNGKVATGRVLVLRGKKVIRTVKLRAKNKGKITVKLAKKYAGVKKVRVRFVPTKIQAKNIAKATSKKVTLRR